MFKLTREQIKALHSIYHRDWDKPSTYLQFRRSAVVVINPWGIDCTVFVPFCNMILGIEPDGYTHS
jgi:hypothetical protein